MATMVLLCLCCCCWCCVSCGLSRAQDDEIFSLRGRKTEVYHSLAEFKQKVEGFRLEQEVVKEYIKNHALGSRQKRLKIGMVALLISFLSFFLSTSGLVVTEQQIDGINRRLDVMSNHLALGNDLVELKLSCLEELFS